MKKKSKQDKIKIGICFGLLSIDLGLVIWALVQMYGLGELNYFTKHFMMCVILILVGIIALIMPTINVQKYSGDKKGETTMIFAGFMLFILAFVSIIMSYMIL